MVEKVDFRIIDMGMARRVYTDKVVTDDILGTNGYHPPEVLFEDGYDFRADVFMLGITFAVLVRAKSCPLALPVTFFSVSFPRPVSCLLLFCVLVSRALCLALTRSLSCPHPFCVRLLF